jgi:uncharacterized protein
MAFIGRTQELNLLTAEYNRPRPSLIVLYGRRRVGKSTLILESLRTREFTYYQASRMTDSDNLNLLKQSLENAFGTSPLLQSLQDWNGIFAYLEFLGSTKPNLTLVLDEFPYLCEANPALPSLLQTAWDRIVRAGVALNLVLCGSSIGFMQDLLLERNPLRGRQSQTLELQPLNYREIAAWVPNWSPEQQIMLAGIIGGMPYYLSFIDSNQALGRNLQTMLLERGAALFNEPDQLLQAELQSPHRYASILHAVARGCHDWGEILGRVKDFKDGAQLAPYIKKLEVLRLLEIKKSFDTKPKDRNQRYALNDPFLRFWYRFVLPNRSALEAGHHQAVFEHAIQPFLEDFMGLAFEEICRQYAQMHLQEVLGVPAKRVGQIWAADYDLDLAGVLLDGRIFYGECKWWKEKVGENILSKLVETSSRTRTEPSIKLLFSKTGFTNALIEHSKTEPNLILLSLPELLGIKAKKRVSKKKKPEKSI